MNKEDLKKKIEEQEKENISLYKIFQYRLHEREMQPLIEEWRKGSCKIKALLKELYGIEDKEHAERIVKEGIEKKEKTFVNGFGEATNKYITSQTHERTEKRRKKEILSFMGCK